jgi:hypothetical protein
MNQQPEQFDSEMLIVADRELMPESELLVTLIGQESGEKNVFGPIILEFLALLEELKTMAEDSPLQSLQMRMFEEKSRQANAILEVLLEQRMISKKLLEVLVEGKTKVGLWIDSVGGQVEQEEKVNFALDYLDRKEAYVHSYVTFKAASAAFDLAFLSNELNALTRSVFMWHFSDSPVLTREAKVRQVRGLDPIEPEAEEEMADLISILKRAREPFRTQLLDRISMQISHPGNPSGAVYLEGDQLHEAGLVHHCYRGVKGLIGRFEKDFPLHQNRHLSFYNTALAESVFRKIRHLPDWQDNKPLELTALLQQKYERKIGHVSTDISRKEE